MILTAHMTKFKHDEFAKELLRALLEPFGQVQVDRPITNELRRIDVYFIPATATPPDDPTLKLLWKCAPCGAAFEPFRSPVQDDEIRSTMGKLFDVHAELARAANRTKQVVPKTEALPQLWIITPTMSEEKLRAANAITKEEEWGKGIYLLGDLLRTGIIVVHQLPKTPETVWFRTLGRGKVQQEAINEIAALPKDSFYRQKILELFADLKVNLESSTNRKPDELELLMTLAKSPLFVEYMERATADARTEGLNMAYQSVVESMMNARFSCLDEQLSLIIPNIIKLPPSEFTPLLLELSREELIDRFTPEL
jgi:hypothetical protein